MKLPALEKNILKYRAFQMILVLFHAESLKRLIISSIQETDRLLSEADRELPEGSKYTVGKAFQILVEDSVLTADESEEVQRLIDYRNDIGNRIHELTQDIGYPEKPEGFLDYVDIKYNYDALQKLKHFRKKIEEGLSGKYIISLSFDSVSFENAEIAYIEELNRLHDRITRQFDERKEKIRVADEVSANNEY